MINYVIHFSIIFICWLLTTIKGGLIFLILKLNTPLIPKKDSLTGGTKGIIILTLVISRVCIKPRVKPGLYAMFNIFKIKTKIETQLEEYITFKNTSSPFIAQDQKDMLSNFIKATHKIDLMELTLKDIESHHTILKTQISPYSVIGNMQAIRAFIRFHKHSTTIKPQEITNIGVKQYLQSVGENVKIIPMTIRKRGRPLNIELVKKVKRLRDNENLTFRAISKAIGKDVKNIYGMYKYDLTRQKSKSVGEY